MKSYCVLLLCVDLTLAGILNRELPLTNVCTQDAPGPIFFPHPTDSNKFLQCAPDHRMFVITCPDGEVYHHATTSCAKPQAATTLQPTVKPVVNRNQAGDTSNPCTPENLANNVIYFPHPSDKTKFIECNPMGEPITLSCPPRLIFDSNRRACAFPTGNGVNTRNTVTVTPGTGVTGTNNGGSGGLVIGPGPTLKFNPCSKAGSAGQFFPHPSDQTLYIQCDRAGDAYIRNCPNNLVWSQSTTRCDSRYAAAHSLVG